MIHVKFFSMIFNEPYHKHSGRVACHLTGLLLYLCYECLQFTPTVHKLAGEVN